MVDRELRFTAVLMQLSRILKPCHGTSIIAPFPLHFPRAPFFSLIQNAEGYRGKGTSPHGNSLRMVHSSRPTGSSAAGHTATTCEGIRRVNLPTCFSFAKNTPASRLNIDFLRPRLITVSSIVSFRWFYPQPDFRFAKYHWKLYY